MLSSGSNDLYVNALEFINDSAPITAILSSPVLGTRPQLFLLYSLIIHSSMNLFSLSRQFILSFFQVFEARETIFFTVLTWQNLLFFANIPVNKQPSTSEVIRRYMSTYEGCDLVPLVTSSIGDSELVIHFQEA